jgi:5-hydroxyisourate hydrolase-like protein (transthyretin family)
MHHASMLNRGIGLIAAIAMGGALAVSANPLTANAAPSAPQASQEEQLVVDPKSGLPAKNAPFDQKIAFFLWPYQFGTQNVAADGQKAKQGKLEVGEYGWKEPGTRPVEPNLKSLDAQIQAVKDAGMEYAKVSYLISSLNVEDGTCDASKTGNCVPSYTLADAIIDRLLKAGLKPIVYFSQGNPDPKTVANPDPNNTYASVPSFTRKQVKDAIHHVIEKFAGKGIIWESWNEPDSEEHWPAGRGDNKSQWIELDRYIADQVHTLDPKASYVFGNMSDGGQLRSNLGEAATEKASAVSSHGYWFGGTPENAQGPATNQYAYMDSEFGCSGNDVDPTETTWSCGFNKIPKDHKLQGIWLNRQFLAKDRSGENMFSPYRLIGYDSFNINESTDVNDPSKIERTNAYKEIQDLVLALKGYSYVPNSYKGAKNGGISTQEYRNPQGDTKLVYWVAGTPTLQNDSQSVNGTVTFNGKETNVIATPLPKVLPLNAVSLNQVNVTVKVGTSPADLQKELPSTVTANMTSGLTSQEAVAWDHLSVVDQDVLSRGGDFTLHGTVQGTDLKAAAHVTVTAHAYTSLPNRAEKWVDIKGDQLQAHGGSIIRANDGTFYWVGQGAPDNVPVPNAGKKEYKHQWLFTTINMYSSKDLMNWKAENPVLSLNDSDVANWCDGNQKQYTGSQPTATIPNDVKSKWGHAYDNKIVGCKIERPHIIYNQKNNEYVVWAHWEGTVGYESSQLIAASAKSPTGPWHVIKWADGKYHEKPTVKIDGKLQQVESRDLSVWVDPDTQKGYIISVCNQGLRLYHLTDDYKAVDPNNSFLLNIKHTGNGLEAPSLFKEGGKYYLFASHMDWWNPTATDYSVSTNIEDPNSWTPARQIQSRGDALNNDKYIGQPTYVLQYEDANHKPAVLLIGDNWNPYHKQTADVDTTNGRYIFTPITRYTNGDVDVPIVSSVVPMQAGQDPIHRDSKPDQPDQPTAVLANGYYRFDTALASGHSLDVASASHANGANVRLWQSNNTDAQVWQVVNHADGTVTLINVESGKALDADSPRGAKAPVQGANVHQWDNAGTRNQRWVPVRQGSGVVLQNAGNKALVLDVQYAHTSNGTNAWLYKRGAANNKAQTWKPVATKPMDQRLDDLAAKNRAVIADGTYRVYSSKPGMHALDVASASHRNGANVRLWNSNGTDAQVWQVRHDAKGYLTLINAESGKALDGDAARGAVRPSQGANVHQWANANTRNQKWIAVSTRDGIELVSGAHDGLVLDLQSGHTANGTNVRLWSINNSQAQRWNFARATSSLQRLDQTADAHRGDLVDGMYEFRLAKANGQAVDLDSASHRNGANIRLWKANGTNAQKWIVRHDAKGYITLINVESGKALDVDAARGAVRPANGANVHQWDNAGTRNQKWIAFRHGQNIELLSGSREGAALDLKSGHTTNGTNIRLWVRNNSAAQLWKPITTTRR